MNMIDEMPCEYGTWRTTAVRVQHLVSRRAAQRSQLLQNLNILEEAPDSALVESESRLLSSRGASEHLEALKSTGAVDHSV